MADDLLNEVSCVQYSCGISFVCSKYFTGRVMSSKVSKYRPIVEQAAAMAEEIGNASSVEIFKLRLDAR